MECNVRASNGRSVTTIVNNYEKLTPQSAIAAANIAFGPFSHCDVSRRESGELKQYRVTGGNGSKRRARKVR